MNEVMSDTGANSGEPESETAEDMSDIGAV